MKQASSNLLLVLAALCIGGAAGVLVTFGVLGQPHAVPAEPSVSPPVEVQIAPIVERMDAQAEVLVRIEDRLNAVLARAVSAPATSTAEGDPLRQPIEITPATSTGDAGDCTGWVSALDEEFAGILVERGLTPFDTGVAKLLTEAGDALRSAREERRIADEQIREDGLLATTGRRGVALLASREEYLAKKRGMVEKLAKALDALIKRNAAEADG